MAESVTTNIAQIEADRKFAIRRFIMVKQVPSHTEDDPGSFLHEADGVCFANGSIIVYKVGMHNSARVEFYHDEDHCTLMNPDWDLRWLDKEQDIAPLLATGATSTFNGIVHTYLGGIETHTNQG